MIEKNVYKLYQEIKNLDECGKKCLKTLMKKEDSEKELYTYGVYLEENYSFCVINYTIFTHEKGFSQKEFQEMYDKAREACKNDWDEEYPTLSSVWQKMHDMYGFDLYMPDVCFLIEDEDIKNLQIPTLKNLITDDDEEYKKAKTVKKIIKAIDDCPGDEYLITMLCCYYEQFCFANKVKDFKYNITNKFDIISIISNLGLTAFKVQTDIEFCKELKEILQSYCDCGNDLDLLIESFENLPELIK